MAPTPNAEPGAHQRRRVTAIAVFIVIAVLSAALPMRPAAAYKPYTHNWTAARAWDDATDDCEVTINGEEYPVIPEVCVAITEYPAYYNAGVIGPDGFPDLTFGQSVIHPEYTGKWLRHLYDEAWARWNAGGDTPENRQILAFTYGFLTHAAGDLWAHTLVNTFADGVFPGVFDMVEEVQNGEVSADGQVQLTEIALRHIIVEGYIGDATPGYDGNDNRTLVPGETNEDGDPEVSDDATPGTAFAMPMDFLYDTLVDPSNPLPVGVCGDGQDDDADGTADDGCPGGPFTVGDDPEPQRGPLIDHFLDLQAELEVEKARFDADKAFTDCADIDPDCYSVGESDEDGSGSPITLQVQTVRGVKQATVDVYRCIGAQIGCVADPIDLADDLIINGMGGAYLEAWIDDIETGLQEWPRLGLELTNLLFDARTYREAQDWACDNGIVDDNEHQGDNGDLEAGWRANCENNVGFGQVLAYVFSGEAGGSSYVTDHLLSMMGAPDFVGAGFELAADVIDFLLDILQTIIPNFDFLSNFFEAVKDLLKEGLNAALGFDVEVLFTFMKHPTYWLDQQTMSISLPFMGTTSVDLFPSDAREELDAIMGLEDPLDPDNDVELPDGTIVQATKLKDTAEWDVEEFAVGFNAIQLSKLVLVDGDTVNDVIKDQLAGSSVIKSTADINTYSDGASVPANVMIDPLSGSDPWLQSIDADHGWRQDAQPINVPRHPGELHGGNGQFPLWESCIARPAFRNLFRDWEPDTDGPGGTDANFGDLGDGTSYDPSATAAALSIDYAGAEAFVGGVQYLGLDHDITIDAVDPVFTDDNVTVHYRTYPTGTADADKGSFTAVAGAEATFSLPEAYTDGTYVIEYQATNPCIGLATAGTTTTVVLDETPPVVTVTSPANGAVFDVNTTSPVSATHVDASSGVDTATITYSFDGVTITVPYTIDTFDLDAGFHTVSSSAADNVANVGSDTNTFEVRPTSAGMLSVLTRARSESLITKNDVLTGLRDTLTIAVKAHQRGKHPTEWNALNATLDQIAAQRGKAIDPVFADRMTGWIEWLLDYEMP